MEYESSFAGRFYSRVDKTSGQGPFGDCWIWTGGRCGHGYGLARVDGVSKRAHRISFILTNGYAPTLQVLHKCDVKLCVNPQHLREGTAQENMDDKVSRSRQSRGNRHPRTRLTPLAVIAIRQMDGQGISKAKIAKHLNVSPTAISSVVSGRTWSWIAQEGEVNRLEHEST